MLLLASSSPRRKELLSKITDDFCVAVPDAEEIEEGNPQEIALTNAVLKGRSVSGEKVLACDTLVTLNGKIYGKPHTAEKAFLMLKELSGKTHSVLSGWYVRIGKEERSGVEESSVTFRTLSDEEIRQYISDYMPTDKAGAYGIQDGAVVSGYTGSYDNIVGLPTERLREILKEYIDVKKESGGSV